MLQSFHEWKKYPTKGKLSCVPFLISVSQQNLKLFSRIEMILCHCPTSIPWQNDDRPVITAPPCLSVIELLDKYGKRSFFQQAHS